MLRHGYHTLGSRDLFKSVYPSKFQNNPGTSLAGVQHEAVRIVLGILLPEDLILVFDTLLGSEL